MTIYESEMWDENVTFLTEGQVFNRKGRPLHLAQLIKRRWGWPKKAANEGAKVLKEMSGGEPVDIELCSPKMQAQQNALFKQDPDVLKHLLNGLSWGSQRESKDCAAVVDNIMIEFTEPIHDEGFTSLVLKATAASLGISIDELRDRADFRMGDTDRLVSIDTGGLTQWE